MRRVEHLAIPLEGTCIGDLTVEEGNPFSPFGQVDAAQDKIRKFSPTRSVCLTSDRRVSRIGWGSWRCDTHECLKLRPQRSLASDGGTFSETCLWVIGPSDVGETCRPFPAAGLALLLALRASP